MKVQGEILIKQPIEVVFDYVADERNEPRYNSRMIRAEKLTPGPVGAGTKFNSLLHAVGRAAEMTIEFVEFDRPHRIVLRGCTTVPNMEVHGDLAFEPDPSGTRMRWRWDLESHGMSQVLGPLVRIIGERQERTIWAGLKRLLEAEGRHATGEETHDVRRVRNEHVWRAAVGGSAAIYFLGAAAWFTLAATSQAQIGTTADMSLLGVYRWFFHDVLAALPIPWVAWACAAGAGELLLGVLIVAGRTRSVGLGLAAVWQVLIAGVDGIFGLVNLSFAAVHLLALIHWRLRSGRAMPAGDRDGSAPYGAGRPRDRPRGVAEPIPVARSMR